MTLFYLSTISKNLIFDKARKGLWPAGPRGVLATIVMEFSPIFVDKMVFASTAT